MASEQRGASREENEHRLVELLQQERSAGERGDWKETRGRMLVPSVDLRTLLAEMTALKAEVRAETLSFRELQQDFRKALALLEKELSRAEQREVRIREDHEHRLRRQGLMHSSELIEFADRLETTLELVRKLSKHRFRWLLWWRDRALLSIVEGLELTLRRLHRGLRDLGINRVETVGSSFDPHIMEAVGFVEKEDIGDGVVVEEITTGYRDDGHQRPIRTAKVIVNRRRVEGK